MKKSISLIIAFASILIITSCSGSQRECAAYAKHHSVSEKPDKVHNPTYKDLQ